MEKSNFALRLQPSLLKAAQRIAEKEHCSVNQLINVAVAEKIAVLDAEYWRARKENVPTERLSDDLLERLAGDEPPQEGDELPAELEVVKFSRKRKASFPSTHVAS